MQRVSASLVHPVPIIVVLVCGLALSTGCGGGASVRPGSPLDTAQTQYGRGLAALAEGDLFRAQVQFDRARALDDDFPGYHVGTALVASARGDHFQAHQQLERALHKDGDFVDAHVARGRVLAAEGQDRGLDADNWLPEARRAFGRAERLAPDRPEPPFERGRVELAAGDLTEAVAAFQRVVELNRGPLVAEALAQIERIQVIQRAAPGTRLGAQIATRETVTRAELAVLLLEELRLEALIEQRRQGAAAPAFAPPGDGTAAAPPAPEIAAASAWARPWIERTLTLGVPGLEPLPDGTFQGHVPLTRSQYARVIEGILSLLVADRGLSTRYVGEPSRFPDVASDHFAYNAIALSVDRGIMSPDRVSGRFRPEDPVSGAEALLIIRDLQNAVRMEF